MTRINIHREVSTTTTKLSTAAVHRERLDRYFAALDLGDREDADKVRGILKHAMEIVYLRQIPLVSFDVEAYERSLRKITEIGISVYDPAASDGTIYPIIKNSHLIIKEHRKLNNHKYCPDNKSRFMGGRSHVVTSKGATKIMSALLEEYIVKRKGAFVGHHISGDIKWLRSLGIKIPDDVPTVDTHKVYSCFRSRGGTLRGVLRLLGIPHGLLHNAGNDAYFTLLAVMALCDPQVREAKNLDLYVDPEKLTKSQMTQEKFSDSATLDTKEDIEAIVQNFIGSNGPEITQINDTFDAEIIQTNSEDTDTDVPATKRPRLQK